MSSPLPENLDRAGHARGSNPDPHGQRGILLINLGTPDSPDVPTVRRYLAEFLADPAVISLPRGLGWLNSLLGATIARFRAATSAEMYRKIWTERGSPLKVNTEDQVASLEKAMPPGWRVFYAMRYGSPGIVETMREIEAAGIDDLVVVSMYPQFSEPTTGTAVRLLYHYLETQNPRMSVTARTTWYDDHGYINAQAKLLEQYAAAHDLRPDNTHLLFSTHGLPVMYVKKGDPYPKHIARTVALVANRLGWPLDRTSLAYQSRLGPVEWLKPYTDKVLEDLITAGEKRVLICPISFTADCLETLEEIDIRYREPFEQAGGELFLAPALNNFKPFISALKHLVLRGPRPVRDVVPNVGAFTPRSTPAASADPDSFMMIGISIAGSLEDGLGPALAYSDPSALHRAKVPQCDVPALLERVRSQTSIRECWLWNTCHRFELYGWIDSSESEQPFEETASKVRGLMFGFGDSEGLKVNVLRGAAARHHLMRTASGLNSGLPGERDVLEQMHAAHRLAGCGGNAGPLTDQLGAEVVEAQEALRSATDWGRQDTNYTHVALSRVAQEADLSLPSSRILVIGGSTTSAGALRTLRDQFHVPDERLTLIYRGHKRGGQMKLLRRAIGGGRRIRVQTYDERCVLDAVAEADVLVFGLDRAEPVLTLERLNGLRDWEQRPLTILDFNIFDSTEGLDAVKGVRLFSAADIEGYVASFAAKRCEVPAFRQAVDEAEAWIVRHLEGEVAAFQISNQPSAVERTMARSNLMLDLDDKAPAVPGDGDSSAPVAASKALRESQS